MQFLTFIILVFLYIFILSKNAKEYRKKSVEIFKNISENRQVKDNKNSHMLITSIKKIIF